MWSESYFGLFACHQSDNFVKRKFDIIIVGGGITGSSAAYFISAQSKSVLLVEMASVGEGCTHASAGLIVPSIFNPVTSPANVRKGILSLLGKTSQVQVQPCLNLRWVTWAQLYIHTSLVKKRFLHVLDTLLELNRQSETLQQGLAKIGGKNYDYAGKGRLNVYRTQKGFNAGMADGKQAGYRGISCEVISADRIKEFEPWLCKNVVGGVYYPEDTHVSPGAFARWLIKQAESRGVHVITNASVFGFRRSGLQVSSVCTTQGEFRARHVILAAGAWLGDLSRMLNRELPIMGAKGYSLTIPRLDCMPKRPLLLEEDHIAIVPYEKYLRLTSIMELGGIDMTIETRTIDRIVSAAQQYTSHLELARPTEVRVGFRPISGDGMPIVGRLQNGSNIWVLGGHGQGGITQGPLAALQIDKMIKGESIGALESALSPSRFFRLR